MALKSIYDFEDYKTYVSRWIEREPRGASTRLAESSGIHKTTLSQILRGDKHLTLEQAVKVAAFIQLNERETEYFILLVELGRSGSVALSDILKKQVKQRRSAHQQLANRVTQSRELTSEERAVFYSDWIYTAVRNLSAIEDYGTPRELAKRLGIEIHHVHRVLEFLLGAGLCLEKNGRILPGPAMTHLEAGSPLVTRHHANWRVKALEKHPVLNTEEELAYTAPMTLSSEDAARIRRLLVEIVEKTDKIVGPSPSQRLFCMNIDWFEVK